MSKRASSRRSILGSGASLLLLTAAAAGVAKADELDGDLLGLCRGYLDLERRVQAISAEIDAIPGITMDQLQGEQEDYREAIEDLPARTPEGIRAKALVLECELRDEPAGVAWSLAQDILGRAA